MIDTAHLVLIAFICMLCHAIHRLISDMNGRSEYIEILSGHPGVKRVHPVES